MTGGQSDDANYRCFGCNRGFESLDDMEPVPGKGNRSPRHFCEDCAERIHRGPPIRRVSP